MGEYLVLVRDFTDADCINRRMQVREKHLDNARALMRKGHVINIGGALGDGDGKLVASALVCIADSEEQIKEVLESDIYVKNNVWDLSTLRISKL
ncbi:hypothetical protein AX774_g496 [Zancudomyces culisetae]|uniref:YCII-related domain-containing protein n=1 Tax=Zancudomyces culisetae TaxID=1213189 RepID=A0A1R1PYC0_ZANCU|nr:hypothetical protein AX774_g496 [Zancudomyces culisetae]|eukprot:OMH85954.1 hypothetical protein AX774_g496 [Zancudomyces culisetae]